MDKASKKSQKKNDRFVGTLLDASLYERVRKAAAEDKRSVSGFVRLALFEKVEKLSA